MIVIVFDRNTGIQSLYPRDAMESKPPSLSVETKKVYVDCTCIIKYINNIKIYKDLYNIKTLLIMF